jgi:hypothetical protein
MSQSLALGVFVQSIVLDDVSWRCEDIVLLRVLSVLDKLVENRFGAMKE